MQISEEYTVREHRFLRMSADLETRARIATLDWRVLPGSRRLLGLVIVVIIVLLSRIR
jgi:hypothetical protein